MNKIKRTCLPVLVLLAFCAVLRGLAAPPVSYESLASRIVSARLVSKPTHLKVLAIKDHIYDLAVWRPQADKPQVTKYRALCVAQEIAAVDSRFTTLKLRAYISTRPGCEVVTVTAGDVVAVKSKMLTTGAAIESLSIEPKKSVRWTDLQVLR